MRQRLAVWGLGLAVFALHMAFAGRYDFFRNELYYIVCGRHPAFGYADEPPLVPLLAAATQMGGLRLWALHVPPALAAALLVPLTADFARRLGAGAYGAFAAAGAAAMAPGLMALAQLMTTSSFEALGWTAVAWLVTRAALGGERRAMIWAGAAAGMTMEAKYGLPFWLAGLALGLAAGPARRVFGWRESWAGLALAVAMTAPSVVWQALHGFPFLGVMEHHAATHSVLTGTPLDYELGQALAMNPVLAPLWLLALGAPFMLRRLAPARFLAVAYVVAASALIAAGGKDYYLFPAYPTLFALGAAACARLPRLLGAAWGTLAVAQSAFLLPIVLPVLSPPALAAYMARFHLHPAPDEVAAIGAPLTQAFSDQFAWRDLEQKMAVVWRGLTPAERAQAAIVASNYGEAAALDVYGAADGLPPALSGQDQYYFWGPRGHEGSIVVHVNGDMARWRQFCASVEEVARFGAPYAMPYENDRPIFICRGLPVPLTRAWPRFERLQ